MSDHGLNLTKLYYKIGEVSKIVGVKPYVLRYWESEFGLRLEKSPSNQRIYQKKDIETFLTIKELLYTERYTIAGAKQKLKAIRAAQRAANKASRETTTTTKTTTTTTAPAQQAEAATATEATTTTTTNPTAYREALTDIRDEIETLRSNYNDN